MITIMPKHSVFRNGILYLLAFCTIFLYGCAAIKPAPEKFPPPDVSSILATLRVRYDLVETMSMWMKIAVESRGRKDEVRGLLQHAKPDKLRLQVLGPFNEPRVIVLAVEKSLKIYFVPENELMVGELSDEVINQIFDVDLRVSDVYSSIFANPFLDGNVDNLQVKSYGDEYLIRRPSMIKGHHEEISILARDSSVSRWRITGVDGRLVQDISFSRYRTVGGVLRPMKAVIYRPDDDTRLSIESGDPGINIELPEMTFDLPVPKGAKVYQLSDSEQSQPPDSETTPDH